MLRQTGHFVGTGEDGRQYTIEVYTNFIKRATFGNPNAEVAGMTKLRTSDGLEVERQEKGVYRIVQTSVVVRSNGPDAP
jgi:hypothetical protein